MTGRRPLRLVEDAVDAVRLTENARLEPWPLLRLAEQWHRRHENENEGQDGPGRGTSDSETPHPRRARCAHSARRLTSSQRTFSMKAST